MNRAVTQHLRVILLKTRKVSKLLESETHHKFLDQKRSFNAIPSVSPVPVLPNSNIQSGPVQSGPVLSRSVSSKPVKSRTSRPLGYHGKLYRFKRLKAQMNESDFKLIAENGQKGKLNSFKVLNFQHEANMSMNQREKTLAMLCQHNHQESEQDLVHDSIDKISEPAALSAVLFYQYRILFVFKDDLLP